MEISDLIVLKNSRISEGLSNFFLSGDDSFATGVIALYHLWRLTWPIPRVVGFLLFLFPRGVRLIVQSLYIIFKFVGKSRFNGVPTYKFKYEKRFVDKNNTYTLHVTQSTPYKPIRYEMVGYDHLLRSHYDHYIIDYFSFEEWDFDYKVLQIPKGTTILFFSIF